MMIFCLILRLPANGCYATVRHFFQRQYFTIFHFVVDSAAFVDRWRPARFIKEGHLLESFHSVFLLSAVPYF